MSAERRIWCAHPVHDEVLPDGKKKCWKTGVKPTHPKGKRCISSELAAYINKNNERIVNGNSHRLSEGDFLCSSCFAREELRLTMIENENMNSGNPNE